MTKDEGLRLALEALEDLGMKHYENTGEVLYKNTYIAIKAALETKDEPVAYLPPTASPENACYTPPQRIWAGLTEEELKPICDEWRIVYGEWMVDFARDIEIILKEKNAQAS